MNDWITKAARRQAGTQAAIASLVLALLAWGALSNLPYLREVFSGPHALSATDLAAGRGTQGWVKVQADKLHATGVQQITVRKKRGVERGRSVSAEYFLAEIGEKLVLVKGVPEQSAELEGEFVPVDARALGEIFKGPELEKVKAVLHSRMIDTHDFSESGSTALWIGGLVAVFALGWGLLGFMRFHDPKKHPAVKPLVAAGQGVLEAASHKIEQDLALPGRHLALGSGVTLTSEYAVHRSIFAFEVSAFADLLWAYKRVTRRKLYFVIPLGKTFAAQLHFRDGAIASAGKEPKVDEALTFIANAAPWAVFGYSDEVKALYDNKQRRRELIVHVDGARAKLAAGATA
jgi:hypothetical protein